jgi:hypothetical protein
MNCYDGVCKELCRFDTDCSDIKMVCCDAGSFGFYEDSLICDGKYELKLESDVSGLPEIQEPASVNQPKIVLFSVLFVLVLFIGITYFVVKRKHNTQKSKK